MAQSLKQIKNRIRSTENTRKVTSAMQMISATKLSRLNNVLAPVRPYTAGLEGMLNNLLAGRKDLKSPFLERREVKKIVLCLIASDNGLCGVYNNNILRLAQEFIDSHPEGQVRLIIVGKKGYNFFKNYPSGLINSYLGLNGRYSQKFCDELTQALCNLFLSQEADEIYVAYTYFKNALNSKAQISKFLNIDLKNTEKKDYIFEPDANQLLDQLIPVYLSARMRLMLLEAFTSEHASRLVAMQTATENAKELLHQLVLLRNKVRQANITREMLEIISSAEALKG